MNETSGFCSSKTVGLLFHCVIYDGIKSKMDNKSNHIFKCKKQFSSVSSGSFKKDLFSLDRHSVMPNFQLTTVSLENKLNS